MVELRNIVKYYILSEKQENTGPGIFLLLSSREHLIFFGLLIVKEWIETIILYKRFQNQNGIHTIFK